MRSRVRVRLKLECAFASMVPNRSPVRSSRLREYAEEVRVIADSSTTADIRQGLLQLAADYEEMAAAREQLEKATNSS